MIDATGNVTMSIGHTDGQNAISPAQKTVPCITLPHSPPTKLEGEIIDMEDGAPSDFNRMAESSG